MCSTLQKETKNVPRKKPSNPEDEVVVIENEHWYQSPKTKQWYPSVTTILGDGVPKGEGFSRYLVGQSSWEAHQESFMAAARRGTRVHEASELLERDGAILNFSDYSIEEWQMIMGFTEWFTDTKPEKTLAIEQSLVSDIFETGGTIDRVYEMNGMLTVLDLKTSKQVQLSHLIQTAVYAALWEEKFGVTVEQTAILRLRTIGKQRYELHTHTREEWQEHLKLFKPAYAFWKAQNPNKVEPTPLTLPKSLDINYYERKEAAEYRELFKEESGEGA